MTVAPWRVMAATAAVIGIGVMPAWAAGQTDPTFNGGQAARTPVTQNIAGGGVAVDALDGVLVEGQEQVGSETYITVTRFTSSGHLDPCFGSPVTCNGNGTVLASKGQTYSGAAMRLQRDGRILASGAIRPTPSSSFGMGVVRLNQDGTLDRTFGTNGIAIINPCAVGDSASAGVMQAADLSIVMVGVAKCPADQFAVARLSATGQPANFGANGTTLSPADTGGYDVAIQSDGKIVAVGIQAGCGSGHCFYVERLNSNGTLDADFGPNHSGVITFSPGGSQLAEGYNIAVVSGGGIVVSGGCDLTSLTNSQWWLCAAKLTTSGSLDPSFANGGTLMMMDGNRGSQTMAVQADGSLVFGSVGPTVARVLSNGQPDKTFGNGGVVKTIPGMPSGAVNGVAVDDSLHRVLAAGAVGSSVRGPYSLWVAALTA